MASAPFSTAARAQSQSPAGASNSGKAARSGAAAPVAAAAPESDSGPVFGWAMGVDIITGGQTIPSRRARNPHLYYNAARRSLPVYPEIVAGRANLPARGLQAASM